MQSILLFIFHVQVFAGNTDQNSIVKHSLSADVQARFVRFYPVTFYDWPCLRVEIFVLKQSTEVSFHYRNCEFCLSVLRIPLRNHCRVAALFFCLTNLAVFTLLYKYIRIL